MDEGKRGRFVGIPFEHVLDDVWDPRLLGIKLMRAMLPIRSRKALCSPLLRIQCDGWYVLDLLENEFSRLLSRT